MVNAAAEPLVLGRYTLYQPLAAGGMATVHLGRLTGEGGFSRTVAIKRLHPQFAADPEFVAGFMDEARLAGRVRHPNVVGVVDVVASGQELLLVMEYVHGETLSRVMRRMQQGGELVPPPIAAAIMCDVLDGLHAAHEARDEKGSPLGIVHRDVSPQNVIVGADGVARVLDFGIAKAAGRLQEQTREGQLKGKLSYMAPEQLSQETSRLTDIYAASVVLWETLTCQRLLQGETEAQTVMKVLTAHAPPPSEVADVPAAYDAVVLHGLAATPAGRFATAREMSVALAKCGPKAEPHEVAEWLERTVHDTLTERALAVSTIESSPGMSKPAASIIEAATEPLMTRSDLSRDTLQPVRKQRLALALGAAGLIGVLVTGGLVAFASHRTREASPAARPSETGRASTSATASISAAAGPAVASTPIARAPASAASPSVRLGSPAPPKPSASPSSTAAKLPDFL